MLVNMRLQHFCDDQEELLAYLSTRPAAGSAGLTIQYQRYLDLARARLL